VNIVILQICGFADLPTRQELKLMTTDYAEFNARKRSGNGGSSSSSNGSNGNGSVPRYRNAVLDDYNLQAGLNSVNPKFGDFCTRVAGEAWGQPLIDQKTKALITIAVDVVNQERAGGPMAVHVDMARQQGATRGEIEELLLFMCVYAGFNKAAACFSVLDEVFGPA
jgi:4-carboxymuconolactone decarboxylase